MTKMTLLTGIRIGKDYHFKMKGTIGLSTIKYKNIIVTRKSLFRKNSFIH